MQNIKLVLIYYIIAFYIDALSIDQKAFLCVNIEWVNQGFDQEPLLGEDLSKTNINYILSRYEHEEFGRKILFFPAKNPQRLIVIFTGAAIGVHYTCLSWFWRENEDWDETAYLFLCDPSTCWYIGNNNEDYVPDYSAIINKYMQLCALPSEQVFTIGGSMGGYAAILYAILLKLKGAIAFVPQINKLRAEKRFAIKNCGNKWIDLDLLAKGYEKLPCLSIIYGLLEPDLLAACDLLNIFREKGSALSVSRVFPLKDHHIMYRACSKKFFEDEIAFFEKFIPYTV